MRALLLLLSAALIPLGVGESRPARADGAATLERVVIVQRHGVRSPTKPAEALARYAAQPWPNWPVGPGELTPHGAENLTHLAVWLRQRYAGQGLVPAAGCPNPGDVAVWADGADSRTRRSGQIFLDGAFPGCQLVARHGPDGQIDPVFDAIETGICPIDADLARQAVIAAAGGDLNRSSADLDAAKAALWDILTPADRRHACADDKDACFMNGRNIVVAQEGVKLSGPLATASMLVENLMLEYQQGMPAGDVGWGRADAAALAKVGPLHNYAADLARHTAYIARHNGFGLAKSVLAALRGLASGPMNAANARLVVIAGHDTNLSNLAGILGVSWSPPDQPDATPPGGALALELWRRDGAEFVRLAFYYQTAEQLRTSAPLDGAHPARRIDLALPGCADGACPLAAFVDQVSAALPSECVWPE